MQRRCVQAGSFRLPVSSHQRPQHTHRYHYVAAYLPEPENIAADDTSRMQTLTDLAFHSHMQQHYPLPLPWHQLPLRPEMASLLISALRCTPQKQLSSPRREAATAISSNAGPSSALSMGVHHASVMSHCKKLCCATSLSSPSATAVASTPAPANLYALLIQWRQPSSRWARGSPHWVNQIPASKLDATGTIPYWRHLSKPCAIKTHPALAPTPPMSPSSTTCTTSLTPLTQHPTAGRANKHAINLCIVGFFWLLRPAKYLHSSGEGRSEAFRLCDFPSPLLADCIPPPTPL